MLDEVNLDEFDVDSRVEPIGKELTTNSQTACGYALSNKGYGRAVSIRDPYAPTGRAAAGQCRSGVSNDWKSGPPQFPMIGEMPRDGFQ